MFDIPRILSETIWFKNEHLMHGWMDDKGFYGTLENIKSLCFGLIAIIQHVPMKTALSINKFPLI